MDIATFGTVVTIVGGAIAVILKQSQEFVILKTEHKALDAQVRDNAARLTVLEHTSISTTALIDSFRETIKKHESSQNIIISRLDVLPRLEATLCTLTAVCEKIVPRDEIERRFANTEKDFQQLEVNIKHLKDHNLTR